MNIIEQIKKGENKRLELKKKIPSNEAVAKTVVAFSNTSGGKLIIGVNDDLSIAGVNEEKIFHMEEKIASVISDMCYPNILPEIYTLNVSGKLLLVIEVFRGNLLPYFLINRGKAEGTFVRIGSTNRKADELMIQELERQKRKQGFDEEENVGLELSELDLSIIYDEFNKTGKKVNLQKLKNLKLIKSEHNKNFPTNALLITLGKLDNVVVKCARFKGTSMNEFIDKKEFTGNLFGILENVLSFLKNHLHLSAKIDGLKRKEEYEIPLVAIREALLNAIVHRDYIRNRDIKVAIYDDIVEITSPGALPNGITLEDISNGRSELRNKVLANLFKELGYIESWGSGISRIRETCKQLDIGFSIEETGDFVRVVFRRPEATGSDRKRPEATVSDWKQPEATAGGRKRLPETDKIISYLKENGEIRKKDVMEILNCKETKAKTILKQLSGVEIEKIEKGIYTYYILKEQKN